MKSASAEGEVEVFDRGGQLRQARSAAAARASRARSLSRRKRASISGVITSETPISSTRATRKG